MQDLDPSYSLGCYRPDSLDAAAGYVEPYSSFSVPFGITDPIA